ncbi:MAG: hypothetical protein C0468_00540 [Planctomyces sp.]|nr:hypothetical protein [Planctomyces sp.]MBA4119777.1 hypothetical protein [Isosphaera sp.]
MRPTEPPPATAPTSTRRLSSGLVFLRQFFRQPAVLGSPFPSNPRVSRALIDQLDLEGASAVAELGPGSGVVTRLIRRRLAPGAAFFAVERNERLARTLQREMPGVPILHDDAGNVGAIMRARGIAALDCVVSSLPWLLFGPELQGRLLREAAGALRPGGGFSMVTYRNPAMASVRAFRGRMEGVFGRVWLERVVWSAFPPASIYYATR